MRIVINRTDAIGDTLLTLPVAQLIKEHYPDAEIIFWVSHKSQDIFEYYKWVDKIWVMDRNNYWPSRMVHSFKQIFSHDIDAYFFIAGSHFPSFFAWLKGIKFRGGLRSKWQSFVFLNNSIRQKRSLVEMHESEYNLLLLEKFKIKYQFKDRAKLRPLLVIPNHEVEEAKERLKQSVIVQGIEWREKIIIIHPGMVGHTLNWPMFNFTSLMCEIEESWPGRFTFVVSFTKSDLPYISKIKGYLQDEQFKHLNKIIYFYDGGILGLKEYLKVLKNAALFIGPSTGTTHLANCLDVLQIAIYSPIKVQSAMRWGPYSRTHEKCRVLIPDVVCGEQFVCAKEDCFYYKCMAKIEVDDVLVHVKELFKINKVIDDRGVHEFNL